GKTIVLEGNLQISTTSPDDGLGVVPGATGDPAVADQLQLNGGMIQNSNSLTMNARRGVTIGSNGGTLNISSATLTMPNPITEATTAPLVKVGNQRLVLQNSSNDFAGDLVI